MNQKKNSNDVFFDERMIEMYPGVRIIHIDDWFSDRVVSRFRVLDEFACNIEEWTKAENLKYRTLIEDEAKSIKDKEMRDDFFEWHGEQVSVYENEYPLLSRSIVIAKAYFIFENELEALVKKLEKTSSLEYKQFKNQNITRQKKLAEIEYQSRYLKDIAKIDIPQGDLWNEINAIRYMRNAIAHNDLKVDEQATSAIRITKYSVCLKLIVKSFRLEFTEGVHSEVINTFVEFFSLIDKELNKKSNLHSATE